MVVGCAQPLSRPYELSRGTCLHRTSRRKRHAGREAIATTDAHGSCKTACASLSPRPRVFEGIQKPYKNSAGATNLNSSFPPHLQLSQASHVSVCPKTLRFKGILQSLHSYGRKQVQRPQSSFCGLLLSVPVVGAMPAWDRAGGCIS